MNRLSFLKRLLVGAAAAPVMLEAAAEPKRMTLLQWRTYQLKRDMERGWVRQGGTQRAFTEEVLHKVLVSCR